MENFKPQSTERILNKFRNLEIPENEVQESLDRVGVPLAEIGPEKSGTVEASLNGKALTIKYREVNEEGRSAINDASILVGLGNILEKPDNWREVTSLEMEQEVGALDFLKLAPAGYKLYFNPDPKIAHGFVTWPSNNVFIIGNIATFRAILTVLHEIGHLWDHERLKASGRERLTDDHVHRVRAEKVRRERAASAFAFAKLRKITKNEEMRRDSINFLKFFALKDYYEQMKEEIEGDEYLALEFSKDFDQGTMDMEEKEQRFYDDWLKWKKTPMYELWKSQSQRETPDDEEYGAWRQWLSESGHNYWKDLPEKQK